MKGAFGIPRGFVRISFPLDVERVVVDFEVEVGEDMIFEVEDFVR